VTRSDGNVVVEERRVATRDGTLLAMDVVRTEGDRPQPVLLLRTPYFRARVYQVLDVVGVARSGWAVCLQDVRGRGGSQGEFWPLLHDAADGADAIAWCASQPWSDGRVAMAGGSYLGLTQWAAAIACPPALKALAPAAAPDSLRAWLYEGGAFNLGLVAPWAARVAATSPTLGEAERSRAEHLADNWQDLLGSPLAAQSLRDLFPPYADWLSPGESDYRATYDIGPHFQRLDFSGFHVAGWYDVFCEGSLRAWRGMRHQAATERARSCQRLIVGPWSHAGLYLRATPEMDFGPEADGLDLRDKSVRWLRRAINGEEVEGGARVFVMGANRWAELNDWPPPAEPVDLYLSATRGARSAYGDGRLTLAVSRDCGTDRFLHDPSSPVPTHGGRIVGPWLPLAGPCDQRKVEARGDVLVYSSGMVLEAVTIMGQVNSTVRFETSGCSADVAVKLVDVHPEGAAFNVLDSVQRSSFTPGKAATVAVDLGSVAHTFLPGHRIRLEISSSNFPRFDVNPSTGAVPGTVAGYEPAVQTVHWGANALSRLTLPITAGRRGLEMAP
jgi:putative CocE/NonD family hydrolase